MQHVILLIFSLVFHIVFHGLFVTIFTDGAYEISLAPELTTPECLFN